MNKDKQSYSDKASNLNYNKIDLVNFDRDRFYQKERAEYEKNDQDVFKKDEYPTRKMTFGKIKYVQK